MTAKKSSSGKPAGVGAKKGAAKRSFKGSPLPKPKRNAKTRKAQVEKKFGVAVRKSTEFAGRKPQVWDQAKRPDSRTVAPTPSFDMFSENPNGFDASVSRAVEASVSEMFRAFNDPTRRAWCHAANYVVRSTVAPRLLRLAMPDGSLITVTISRKGNVRCMVDVLHSLLPTADAAEQAKRQWRESLSRLAGLLAE